MSKSIVNIIGILLILALVIVPRIHITPVPPTPPTPPTPVTSPLRVLIAYDSTKVPSWTADKSEILIDTDIRSYLNTHCPVEDGQPAARVWDENSDISTAPKFKAQWDAAKAAGKDPSIVITTTSATNVFDLPADKTATLDLLKKFGGN